MTLTLLSRRSFLVGTAAAAATVGYSRSAFADEPSRYDICAFVKFIQSLSYNEMSERLAEMGFDGIEATIRNGGQIDPAAVEDELPKLVDALKKHGLDITIMASSVSRVDEPHTERVLRTASALGVKRYRLAYYRYDLKKPIAAQIKALRPVLKDLAQMNRELGLTGIYQNHAGASIVGATVWDLVELFDGYSPDEYSIAFDIRHATVEGGLAWPALFNVAQPHLGAIYVKDFQWDGRKVHNVPLGSGRIDKGFFTLLKNSGFRGPVSLHVEYLEDAGVKENLAALRTDLAALRKWLAEA